jgi:secondary thiamine-phosphate synthase enzyme
MKKIKVKTTTRIEMVDVTHEVQNAVKESGVNDGICICYVPHTTAGVTVNEHADPSVAEDILDALSEHFPHKRRWRHAEGNADAHVKSTVVAPSITIPVENGRLTLGTWQGVFFGEFDGPRSRDLFIQIIKAE